MKTVILAGGYGTRLSEYTGNIPKPMVTVGGLPILWHIMNTYAYYGYKEFLIALGYKSHIIKEFFLNYSAFNSDFTIDLKSGKVTKHLAPRVDWKVTLVDTGTDTMTGGRVKRLKDYVGDETFMLTYGDGVSDVNIDKLIDYHKSQGKMVTLTAVRPTARFGELYLKDNSVTTFKEKPQLNEGWINGGYFVVEPSFIDLIDDDQTMLEREPLERASSMGQLMAYKHDGFWQCMDTKRDHALLEKMWGSDNVPWKAKA